MTGVFRFKVTFPAHGEPLVSFLDGPNQNAWQMLVASAHEYIASKKYWLADGTQPKSCSYIASVEYRQLPEQVDDPNNFFRVTVIDEAHTLIEVKPTTPTVNY